MARDGPVSAAGASEKAGGSGVVSLASIRTSIQAAVAEAAQCGEEERRKRIRQLQLRWHPGTRRDVREGLGWEGN
jgi:hypothetical protein